MKIAIHNSKSGFHPRWIDYCQKRNLSYKLVDCYHNDIINQLKDCKALMWHFNQGNPKDILFAKQLMFALEQSGIKVFPDFNTAWHFNDKVGQKYLLDAFGAPLVPSYVFYNKQKALEWINQTTFPKVWKLRGGASSANVKLIKSPGQGQKFVNKAFGKGFKQYDAWSSLNERWRKFRLGKTNVKDVVKGIIRLGYKPKFSRINGREQGYILFQDYIPNNDSDTRIIVVDNKAFALKRMVRKNDFRASGSGNFRYAREEFDERCIRIAFDLTDKLRAQCVAYDFVFDKNNKPLIVEISYGFTKEVYDPCPGYWDKELNWHQGKFNPYGWMVESLIRN